MIELFKFLNESNSVVVGPYWSGKEWTKHGKKFYWTEEELLDLPFSDSIKKRIPKLRIGTKLQVYTLGRYTFHAITRLNDEEENLIQDLDALHEVVKEAQLVVEEVAAKELEALNKAKSRLDKHKRKMRAVGLPP